MSSNSTTNKPLTIGIDARLCGKRHAGIGRYIENLLVELVKLKPNSVKFIFFFHDQEQEQAIKKIIGTDQNYTAVFVPIRHYSLEEQLRWPKILHSYHLHLLHVPHFNIPLLYRGKIIITIHDLLWHEQIGPQATTLSASKYYLKYLAYRLVTSQALMRAKKILVPTQTVKNILAKFHAQALDKTVVTYEGISDSFLQIFEKLKKNPQLLTKKFNTNSLIYVGSLYPHKNIEVVLQALTLNPKLLLTIVCARNVFLKRTQERIKELQLEKQVTLTGYLTDQQLISAMQSSLALIQPSKSEGFGLTAIEAMAAGTPVIASNLPVFQELYADAPMYFNPNNVNQLLAQINNLQQPKLRVEQIKKGLKVADQYSWSKMAQITLDQYLSVED